MSTVNIFSECRKLYSQKKKTHIGLKTQIKPTYDVIIAKNKKQPMRADPFIMIYSYNGILCSHFKNESFSSLPMYTDIKRCPYYIK